MPGMKLGYMKWVVDKLNRRRLPVVLKSLKFAESVREAVTFIEQGRKKMSFLKEFLNKFL